MSNIPSDYMSTTQYSNNITSSNTKSSNNEIIIINNGNVSTYNNTTITSNSNIEVLPDIKINFTMIYNYTSDVNGYISGPNDNILLISYNSYYIQYNSYNKKLTVTFIIPTSTPTSTISSQYQEIKPEIKPENKPENKLENKLENKPENKFEINSEIKSEINIKSELGLKYVDNILIKNEHIKILKIRNVNDTINTLLESKFRLRVNIPEASINNENRIKVNSENNKNYYYLGVEKINPNCNILINNACEYKYVDNRNCLNKNASINIHNSNYRYVLISEKSDNILKENTIFTLKKNNNKLYLENINTQSYPKLYKDDSALSVYGDLISKGSNYTEVQQNSMNIVCNEQIKPIKLNEERYNISCKIKMDGNMYLTTTNNQESCSSITITINEDNINENTINININKYSIYGVIEDIYTLIKNNNIERVSKKNDIYNLNMVTIDLNKNNVNKLNFNIELVECSNKIYENNIFYLD